MRAAEKIFAYGGYRAMALREVTKEARVNLAAVNYHFGSKSGLMRAIVRHRFEPINRERLRLLDASIEQHHPSPFRSRTFSTHSSVHCLSVSAMHL